MTPEQLTQDQEQVRRAYRAIDKALSPLTPEQRERVLRMIDELLNRKPQS